MHLLLEVVFAIVLLCTVATSSYFLWLFNARLPWQVGGAGTFFLTVFYVYTGVKLNDPTSLRGILVSIGLDRDPALAVLAVLLALVIAALLLLAVFSETLSFEPDKGTLADRRVRVALVGRRPRLLGTALADTPLVKRLLARQRDLRFEAEGFEPMNLSLIPHRGSLLSRPRAIPVHLTGKVELTLLAEPRFVKRSDFLAKDYDRPARLNRKPRRTLRFEVTASSVNPIWVSTMGFGLVVTSATPQIRTTFPYYGERSHAAPGARPVYGFAEIFPQEGLYEIQTTESSRLGGDVMPSEFNVEVFAEEGFEYRMLLHARWADDDASRSNMTHTFPDEILLELPSEQRWEDLVIGAREVRVVFYDLFETLLRQLDGIEARDYTVLIVGGAWARRRHSDECDETHERVFYIPEGVEAPLTELLGGVPTRKGPRNFMLLDDSILLLQDDPLDRAQLIKDPAIIAEVRAAYDLIAAQAGAR